MSLTYSPKIATDGLLMCLDASNNKSYPATDLPVKNGLALWLDAADDTTFSYSSGTSVSQWRDKSGNNFHASQGLVASQPSRSTFQNSRKTVNFDGTNDTVTIPNFTCNSEMSIFVVSNCGNTLFIEQTNDVNSSAAGFYIYGYGNGMFLVKRNSTYSFSSLTDWLVGGFNIASGVNSTGLDLLAYKNGSQQTPTYDGRTSLSNSYFTNTLYIGSRGASSIWSSGPIAEIIIYNRKVTNAERNSIHTYLGQKWGISNTDRSIIDLAGNDDNGLFGNGTVANMPDYDFYNKGTLSFTQTSNDTILTPLPITSTPALSNFTYEVWTKLNRFPTAVSPANAYGLTYRVGFLFGAGYYSGAGLLWYGYPTGDAFSLYAFIRGSDAYRSTNGYPFALNQYYHCVMVNNYGENKLQLYINGTLYHEVATATAQYDAGLAADAGNIGISKAQVDGGGTANYSHYDGIVAAARIYNKALSAAEVAQNYEAQKSKFANTIVQQGLVLNLDAGNPYSYAGSGTTWYDVSGTGNNGTLTNGPTYNSTNGGVIVLDGVDDYITCANSTSLQITSALTLEIWFYNTAAVDGLGMIVKGPLSSDYDYMLYLSGSSTTVYFYKKDSGGNSHYGGVTLSLLNRWLHIVVTHTSGGLYIMYVNGVASDSSTFANSSIRSSSNNLLIGAGWNPDYFYGNIGETRIYNVALSAAQVLQNYNATKGRYGL